MKSARTLTLVALVSCGLLGASLLPASALPSTPAAEPVVAFWTDTNVVVSDPAGATVGTYPNLDAFSLNGGVLVGSRRGPENRREAVYGFDLATGAQVFKIKNAFAPVALAGGSKVGFLPDRFAQRDPQFNSVWVRNSTGKVRKVMQFSNGPGAPGIKSGFRGEGVPLSVAFDDAGRTLAVSMGNDVSLLIYDVWVVDVKTKDHRRLTKGKRSRFPSLSPSGDQVALLTETEFCGGPGPGYRAGNIRVLSTSGNEKFALTKGTCELFYTDPRWIDEFTLTAVRLSRTDPGEYDADLVKIDTATHTVTDMVTAGRVLTYTVSPSLGLIAYSLLDVEGFSVLDLQLGTTTNFTEGFVPHLAGESRF